MTQSLHAIVWYLFIIRLQNLMRAMHVYLTSTSSMCITRKLEYQWHATQCLSYSSWSHMAHVEALSRPPCVDWSQWHAAGSRRMYSSSLSHTGGTCMKRIFACAVLIDNQWSERLYTRQIITWGGSWYKIATAHVPACACEGMSACMACVHIFASCMYRQYGLGRTSTFFWNK